MVDNSPHPLDSFHASSLCSLPSPFLECHNMLFVIYHDVLKGNEVDYVECLGNFRGYDPSLDPYSLYLGSMPAKIILTSAFDHLKIFQRHLINFEVHLLLFLNSCLSALIHILLSCMLRCLISLLEL